MTPSRGFTGLFVSAPSNGALQWRVSSLTPSSPCKEDFSFSIPVNSSISIDLHRSRAKSQRVFLEKLLLSRSIISADRMPLPVRVLVQANQRPPCPERSPHSLLSLHRDFCSCTSPLWLATETQRSDKRGWNTTWDGAEKDAGADISICILEDVYEEKPAAVWCSRNHRGLVLCTAASRETPMSVPAPPRSPQSLFPHPQASHTAVKLHSRVGKKSPRWIKQKENEAFPRFTQKVNYGATYTS